MLNLVLRSKVAILKRNSFDVFQLAILLLSVDFVETLRQCILHILLEVAINEVQSSSTLLYFNFEWDTPRTECTG